MNEKLNMKIFFKLGLVSGSFGAVTTYLMWIIYNSLGEWDPYRSEVFKSVAKNDSIEVFVYLLLFSALLGLARKYLLGTSRAILLTYVLAALASHLILAITFSMGMLHFILMVAFVVPLDTFYRAAGRKQWINSIKIISLVIAFELLFEFIRMISMPDYSFRYFSLPVKAWFFAFVVYGPALFTVNYTFSKYFSKHYYSNENLGEKKLFDYLKIIFTRNIEYTFLKE
ncbi:MAG: hypothetical protein IIB40_12320 [Candidatus Marinimicrobia bacterium]|nr:hypothetical protein [Candidatus Neomarinimicrobiota bacterium]